MVNIVQQKLSKSKSDLSLPTKTNQSDTHQVSIDLVHQLPEELLSWRHHEGFVVELTGLLHCQQVTSPNHKVLTHAQQQALQLCTQLDRLGRKWGTAEWMILKYQEQMGTIMSEKGEKEVTWF